MSELPKQPGKAVECEWSTNADPGFLLAQRELTIFLKDGYSFFRANAEILTRRFADPTKLTHILIVHPDSPFMAAVANMDDKKKGDPESQKSDCMQAVGILQEIRNKLAAEGSEDCAARITFRGHDNVPTWNGFIGDDTAVINLYTTRPYRGSLPSLKAQRDGISDGGMMYEWASNDCSGIREQMKPDRNNLWNYRLPSSLPDLRK